MSIYAVRTFAPNAWGHYSTALALVALFSVVSGAGLGPLALREMSAAPKGRQQQIVGVALQALGWTSLLAVAGLFAVTPVLGYPTQVLVMVAILAPLLVCTPGLLVFGAVFNARSKLIYVACFQSVQALVYGGAALLVLRNGSGVTWFAVSSVVASLVAVGVALVLLRRGLTFRIQLAQPRGAAFAFTRLAIPFGAIGLVGIVYDRTDVLMLSVLSDARSVAHYTVPYGFVKLGAILPSVVSAVFFPLLNRRLATASPEAESLFFLVVRLFVLLSLPMSLALSVGSSGLLPFVFGHRYAVSAHVLAIMAWTVTFTFLDYALWYGLIAAHQERRALLVDVAGLATNVAVNSATIPLYGPSGAAVALVVSETVVLVGQATLIHRHLFRLRLRELIAKPIVVGGVCAAVATFIGRSTPIGGASVGAVGCFGALIALRYVTPAEWAPVLSALRLPVARISRGG